MATTVVVVVMLPRHCQARLRGHSDDDDDDDDVV